MINMDLVLANETGLHARPARLIVNALKKYESSVEITNGDRTCNAKSLTGILTLGAHSGAKLSIKADGKDEKEAIDELKKILESEID
jgi:phosphocarrier protein